MGFFQHRDFDEIKKVQKDREEMIGVGGTKTIQIRIAMTHALAYYINALSDLPSQKIGDFWFSTGLEAPSPHQRIRFFANTNGRIKMRYERTCKEKRSSIEELRKMVQSGIDQYKFKEEDAIYLGNCIFDIGLLACKTKTFGGGYKIIEPQIDSIIEENVRKAILKKVKFVVGGGFYV